MTTQLIYTDSRQSHTSCKHAETARTCLLKYVINNKSHLNVISRTHTGESFIFPQSNFRDGKLDNLMQKIHTVSVNELQHRKYVQHNHGSQLEEGQYGKMMIDRIVCRKTK